ncbi:MAG: hypothetical protein IPK12_05930 [Gemmatimonadetes bacterium]|nr:hypothetical protein [Gemmatimonadota bacterium]
MSASVPPPRDAVAGRALVFAVARPEVAAHRRRLARLPAPLVHAGAVR